MFLLLEDMRFAALHPIKLPHNLSRMRALLRMVL